MMPSWREEEKQWEKEIGGREEEKSLSGVTENLAPKRIIRRKTLDRILKRVGSLVDFL